MTTEKTKTSEEKIIENQELKDKQKLEAEKEAAEATNTNQAPTAKELYATAEIGLNIRATASVEAEVMGSIPYGEKITPTSDDGVWLGVTYAGATGFAKKEFFTETAPAALSQ